MLSKFAKILIIAGVGVLILPLASFGQIVNIPYALSSELGVEVIPNYPRPYETIFINLTLYTDDLNSADITWYKNNKAVLNGKGETRYSFAAGGAGEEINIGIQIRLLNGISFSKTFTLNPAGIDLVWEANSYVPPFYRGKALHPRQGVLKVVAMPEFIKSGKRISPEKLIYQWSNGTEAYQGQSGYGKRAVILNGSILGRSERISVLVTDPINNLVAEGFMDIPPVEPQVVFYENSPYYGHIFDSAVAGPFDLKTEEVQVLAAPYYFTNENRGLLKYEWRLNNISVPGLSGSRTAVFRKPEGERGKSSVSLRVENSNRILQQADGNFTINFED